MTTKKKAAGLDALANVKSEVIDKPVILEAPIKKSTEKKTKSFPLHLPLETHKVLRELAFHEDTSMTKIILEGVDVVFKERGLRSIAELKDK